MIRCFRGFLLVSIAVSTLPAAAAPAPAPPTQILTSELFSFHSDPLLNLHHFLYRWGQVGPGAEAEGLDPRMVLSAADLAAPAEMSSEQGGVWDDAVSFYRSAMIEHDLLFDDEMVELRDCIVYAGNYCDDVEGAFAEALEVLQRTMNVYRAHWWSRHNRANREWINAQLPAVRRFENDIAPRVAAAYGGEWPDPWTRVDVMPYANRVGGYTTGHPHITISSIDPGNQGYLGLELLFHEASHGDSMEGPLRRLINASFEAAGERRPPDLWHMTIFFTAGEMTRSVLAGAGEGDYTPYAEFSDIWGRRPDNTRSERVLRQHWLPALQAGGGYREAMRNVAVAWTEGR